MWAEMKSASRLDGFEIDEWWVGEGRGGGGYSYIWYSPGVCRQCAFVCVLYHTSVAGHAAL